MGKRKIGENGENGKNRVEMKKKLGEFEIL